jgi:hypothetical protein
MDTKVRKIPHLPAIFSTICIVETLGHSHDKVVGRIGSTTITKTRIVPGSLSAEKSASCARGDGKNACPAGVCVALLQLINLFRCRHRSREGKKDKGEESEKDPGELIHSDVEVRKARHHKGFYRRNGGRVVAEEGRDDSTEELRCKKGYFYTWTWSLHDVNPVRV